MAEIKDRTGETRLNNNGEEMKIVRYGGATDIDVQFIKDGTIVENREYGAFKAGRIDNPMTPSVFGVGFIGKGRFKTRDANGKQTKCYKTWFAMMQRCYSPKLHEKRQTYKNCRVCKEWHNFQVFAEWFYSHFYEFGNNERMTLDKDILHKGNKVYSDDTCVFVPNFINNLFVKCNKSRGNCPIGVSKNRNKYVAMLNKGNERIYLGIYTTPEEAFQVYKKAKESYIKELAEEYKQKIPYELYQALMNYEVEIDD